MSGTKSQREMRAAALLGDLQLGLNGARMSVTMDSHAEEYQRGFAEGYELGKEHIEPAPTTPKVNPLKAVKKGKS